MSPETLEALKASIAHWEENARAQTPEEASSGSESCALCQLFMTRQEGACEGCPVLKRTGFVLCIGTPYSRAAWTLTYWRYAPGEAAGAAFRAAAQAEVEFLRSLLSEEDLGGLTGAELAGGDA